jgi:hypothetical protein
MLLRMVVSLDHLNIIANLLFMGTSVAMGLTWWDFVVIFVDLASLLYFQSELFDIFRRHRNIKTRQVKDLKEQHLMISAFSMQNGKALRMPVSFMINGV